MTEEEVSGELLESIERRTEDLRNVFEQYFMGTRKRPPLQDRTTIQFLIRRISNQNIPNTRLRFRFQQCVAKFNSYNQYWNRTLQQIESGTYFRDRFKQQLHSSVVDQAPDAAPKAKAAAGKKDAAGGLDAHIDQVHKAFVEARKQLKQSTNVSREKLAESIKKQMPALKERYKGKNVKFKVVVEGGKAKLKATIK
jgi:hypothetical protein